MEKYVISLIVRDLGHWELFQFGSYVFVVIAQSLSCVRLCNPMECGTPSFPVLHYVL